MLWIHRFYYYLRLYGYVIDTQLINDYFYSLELSDNFKIK